MPTRGIRNECNLGQEREVKAKLLVSPSDHAASIMVLTKHSDRKVNGSNTQLTFIWIYPRVNDSRK